MKNLKISPIIVAVLAGIIVPLVAKLIKLDQFSDTVWARTIVGGIGVVISTLIYDKVKAKKLAGGTSQSIYSRELISFAILIGIAIAFLTSILNK